MYKKPLVSIVIVNYKEPRDTLALLTSLQNVRYSNFEIVLVDNGAEVDRAPLFKSYFSTVNVYSVTKNLGFAGGANLGIRKSKGEFVLLLNNDTIVPSDFLEPLVQLFQQDAEIGMVSPKIKFYDNPELIQYAGASQIDLFIGRGQKFGYGKKDIGQYDHVKPTGLCNGACMMIRKKVFEDVGLLSELYFMYYEEHDFCLRAKRLGWKAYYAGNTNILHKQSMSIGKSNPLKLYYQNRNRIIYMRRFSKGISLVLFYCFLIVFQIPSKVLKHLIQGQFVQIKYLFKAVTWNIQNFKLDLK